mmetsp:Transcript_6314/g.10030  ORF Transcript_6314/g.10030 Transcript_6314/m.10030 type:complete len:109 (-) Transcript_6314:19-345(-)
MALVRSALAKKPSASAAQTRAEAATSLPSATAIFPTYSAPMPTAAEKAAEDGGNTSKILPVNKNGDANAEKTDKDNNDNSKIDNCGFCTTNRSNICTIRRNETKRKEV